MRPYPYIALDGIEVANANRTLAYVRDVLDDPRFVVAQAGEDCFCDAVDDGPYISPAADDAPWYASSDTDSGEFLGLWLLDLEVTGGSARAVTPRGSGGASLGVRRARPRVIAGSGYMFARTDAGMKYGERWLEDVLAGNEGCGLAEARILPACPGDYQVAAFRILTRVGLVDGPIFGGVEGIPSCVMQRVAFQLVAGNPSLQSQATNQKSTTVIPATGTVSTSYTAADSPKVTAARIIIEAGGPSDVSCVRIFAEPCAGYTDTYSDSYDPPVPATGSMPYVEYHIVDLPAETRLVIDAVEKKISVTQSGTDRVVGGAEVLSWIGPLRWIEASGAQVCIDVETASSTVNSGTTITIETVDREG